MLVVVFCRDRIAILRFSTGQRQISLIASLQVLKAIWLRVGTCAISSASAELQTGAQSQLSFRYFAFLTL